MKLAVSSCVSAFLHVCSIAALALPAPEGCTVLSTDADFPAPDVWAAALPGVLPRKLTRKSPARPDYRFTARSTADVERAVQFVTKHNLRLSIINTGTYVQFFF
jgi:hypothetical protein